MRAEDGDFETNDNSEHSSNPYNRVDRDRLTRLEANMKFVKETVARWDRRLFGGDNAGGGEFELLNRRIDSKADSSDLKVLSERTEKVETKQNKILGAYAAIMVIIQLAQWLLPMMNKPSNATPPSSVQASQPQSPSK